jgi:D-alanyl-D-alanine carboxypeptidase
MNGLAYAQSNLLIDVRRAGLVSGEKTGEASEVGDNMSTTSKRSPERIAAVLVPVSVILKAVIDLIIAFHVRVSVVFVPS